MIIPVVRIVSIGMQVIMNFLVHLLFTLDPHFRPYLNQDSHCLVFQIPKHCGSKEKSNFDIS